MIIECPACATRYNIQASFPPEGRAVRCAKCGHVWRATPLADPDEADASEADGFAGSRDGGEARDNQEAAAGSHAYLNGGGDPDERRADQGDDEERFREETDEADDGRIGRHHGEDDGFEDREPQHDAVAAQTGTPAEAFAPSASAEAGPDDHADGDGKVRWFGRFRKSGKPDRDHHQLPMAEANEPRGGKTILFPSLQSGAAIADTHAEAEEPIRSLEDARAAVRGVFASLTETRPADNPGHGHGSPILSNAASTYPGPGSAAPAPHSPEGDRDDLGWSPSARDYASEATYRGDDEGEAGAGDEEDRGPSDAAYLRSRASLHADDDTDPSGDPDASGDEARSLTGEDGRDDEWSAASSRNDRIALELQDKLRGGSPTADADAFRREPDETEDGAKELAASLWRRPSLPLDKIADDTEDADRSDYGTASDPEFEERLAREIEGRRTQHASPLFEEEEGKRRGGLVVAAAWGMFLCLAAGMIVGFVAFRDMIAAALPGAAPVYRELGMPVTVQPLVFEEVSHRWAVAENGKPMLVITGSIFNRAHRKLPVPLLYVGVKDKDPAADREFRTLLQTDRRTIRPGRSADFNIELVGPQPSLRAIELEIRNIR